MYNLLNIIIIIISSVCRTRNGLKHGWWLVLAPRFVVHFGVSLTLKFHIYNFKCFWLLYYLFNNSILVHCWIYYIFLLALVYSIWFFFIRLLFLFSIFFPIFKKFNSFWRLNPVNGRREGVPLGVTKQPDASHRQSHPFPPSTTCDCILVRALFCCCCCCLNKYYTIDQERGV